MDICSTSFARAYVSMGSNMGDSPSHLAAARNLLAALPGVRLGATSSVYKTEPQGLRDQPFFYNQVVELLCDCHEGADAEGGFTASVHPADSDSSAVAKFSDTRPTAVDIRIPPGIPPHHLPDARSLEAAGVTSDFMAPASVTPESLLDMLLGAEKFLGRVREGAERFGPRVIDLDLLLFGNTRIDTPRLVLPHPRLVERAFVLVPLAEIAPGLALPQGFSVEDALSRICFSCEDGVIMQGE